MMTSPYLIGNNPMYLGFKLNKGNAKENYKYDTNQLDNIIGLLTQARDTISRPCVYEATLILEPPFVMDEIIQPSNFDVKSLKTVLIADSYSYHWTIEHSKKDTYHIHIMIIFSRDEFNPFTHWRVLQRRLSQLDGVVSAAIKPRHNNLGKFHDLTDDAEYVDAIKRFTYQAKMNQKVNLSFKERSFGCSKLDQRYKISRRDVRIIHEFVELNTLKF
ncbi:YagK/YfjJ domain-containing protein [Aquirhabdus parva]|uniref:Inovirus Gp2 family protein n=1 Tax=Aquirhabdus parva TaxID=2283318 RepID=A0A345P7L4_9GAMM|nr:inovirus-type Gp2 protein [Aquirhabdus parva]AXI03273.1 inovirus Gp2 family protein [Aquirhabdus parva]